MPVSVMLSVLRQQGVTAVLTAVLEDSSCNGGAAVATYAAAGGMRAKILVPASTQPGKTVQMRAHCAEVELIDGPRQATADEAIRQSDQLFYASYNWQAFFLEGTKTLAYELWEDLGFRAPDNIIMPMGAAATCSAVTLALASCCVLARSRSCLGFSAFSQHAALRSMQAFMPKASAPFRSKPVRPLQRAQRSHSRYDYARSYRRCGAPAAEPLRFLRRRSRRPYGRVLRLAYTSSQLPQVSSVRSGIAGEWRYLTGGNRGPRSNRLRSQGYSANFRIDRMRS